MNELFQDRMIPLINNFMLDKSINARIWVYLQLKSYVGLDLQNIKHRFIYKNIAFSENDLYKQISNYIEIKQGKKFCCYNTFRKDLRKLYSKNFIEKGEILSKDGLPTEVYYLNEFIPYKLIPIELLKKLFTFYDSNTIKIYAYLVNKWDFIQEKNKRRKENKLYQFTQEELSKAIGYTSTHKIKEIGEILKELQDWRIS